MKTSAFLTILLTSFSLAEHEYQTICPTNHGISESIGEGSKITYSCGMKFLGTAIAAFRTENIIDCAQKCQKTAGCSGGNWSPEQHQCQLFSTGQGDLQPGGRGRSVIVFTIEADDSVLEASLSKCEKAGKGLQEQLDECLESNHNNTMSQDALSTCESKNKDLAGNLEKCQVESKLDVKEPKRTADMCFGKERKPGCWLPNCPSMHGRESTYEGVKFKTWCNRELAKPIGLEFFWEAQVSFDECINECSKQPKCGGLHYYIPISVTHSCKLFGTINQPFVNTTGTAEFMASAVKVK